MWESIYSNLPTPILGPRLTHLALPNNCIQVSEESSHPFWNTIGYFTNLESLDLSNNEISVITTEDLEHMQNLTELVLNNNPGMEINSDLLTNLRQLKYLGIQSMNLTNIGNMSVNYLSVPNNLLIEMSGNTWHCDCRARWLQDMVRNQLMGAYVIPLSSFFSVNIQAL